MDLLDKNENNKENSKRPKMTGWECALNLGKILITSGYGLALILMLGFVASVWGVFGGMSSSDKKDTLLAIMGWPALSILGWIASALTIFISRYLLRFQSSSYEKQIEILRNTKDKALTIQERLPLDVTKNNDY